MDLAADIPLRTPVPLLDKQGLLSHSAPVLTLGSCFSDNIGRRLNSDLFDVAANPFGPLFNPASVADALTRIIDNRRFTRADLECNSGGEWYSFDLYTGFSSVDPSKVIARANDTLDEARRILTATQPPLLIITFGTAYVYSLSDNPDRIVANCHKQPSGRFIRSRLSVEEISGKWISLLNRLQAINPGIKVIFTVSPVRHLADGAHGNALSKSLLLLATDRLSMNEAIYYPAYEILLDDLRDYRFYASDMAHPSDLAVDYIYNHFVRSFCTDDELTLIKKCRSLWQRFHHRPIVDNPLAYASFISKSRECAADLVARHPSLSRAVAKLTDSFPPLVNNEL